MKPLFKFGILLFAAVIVCCTRKTNNSPTSKPNEVSKETHLDSKQLNWGLTVSDSLKSGNTFHSTLHQYLWDLIMNNSDLPMPSSSALIALKNDHWFMNSLDTNRCILVFGKPDHARQEIARQFKKKFNINNPSLPNFGETFLGYAYQKINAPFEVHFAKQKMKFNNQLVGCLEFNPRSHSDGDISVLEEEMKILYYDKKSGEAVVKLTPGSGDVELFFVLIAKPVTFKEGFEKTQQLIEKGLDITSKNTLAFHINYGDNVQIPFINLNQSHEYKEFEGIRFCSKYAPIETFIQSVDFKLDEKGFQFEEEISVTDSAAGEVEPKVILFNRPFYAFVKEKNAKKPCINLWIENTDLLVPTK